MTGKGRFLVALAVFLLIAVTVPFAAAFLPDHTRTLERAQEILSRAYIDRVVGYLVSGQKPKIVVTGSSLVIFPHVATDGYLEKVPVPLPDPIENAKFLETYVDMAYFRKQLESRNAISKGQSVVDLGVPSLMLSDCDLLIEKLQNNHCLPAVLVLFLAPRDFMDNTVAAERNLFMHDVKGRVTSAELLGSGSTIEFWNRVGSALSYEFNEWSKRFKSSGQRLMLAIKKGKKKPYQAAQLTGADMEKARHYFYYGSGKLSDLGIYKKRYVPANHTQIKDQMVWLGKVLDRLQSHSVLTYVVNMPLTQANIDLIEPAARDEIYGGMKQACLARHISFIDAPKLDSYSNSDFLDSVHLNVAGGEKLFKRLAQEMTMPTKASTSPSDPDLQPVRVQ